MKTKTYFAFRVDVWDGAGENIVEHVAGVDDFETAVVRRWPKAKITLRQGARVVHKNWREPEAPPARASAGMKWMKMRNASTR